MLNKLFNLLDSKKEEINNLKLESHLITKEIIKIRNSSLRYNEIVSQLKAEEFMEILNAKLDNDNISNAIRKEITEQGKVTNVKFEFNFNDKKFFIDIPIYHVKYRETLRYASSYLINFGYVNGCIYNSISLISDINELSTVIKNTKDLN